MKRSEAFPSKYLKAADLPRDGIGITIKSISRELVGDDVRPVAKLHGHTKSLALNPTNWDLIVDLLREEDSDRWIGREIPIYPTQCPYKGEIVDCIRVRERAPVEQRPGDSSVRAMLKSFEELNVTRTMLEQRLGVSSIVEITAHQRDSLRALHTRMVAGESWPEPEPDLTGWARDRIPAGELTVTRGW